MRVHVICAEQMSERILARLVRDVLAGTPDEGEWSASRAPDPSAAVNLFFPYLEWARHAESLKGSATRTAAFFTHLETGNKGKAAMWEQAARGVDLRLVMAERYWMQLASYGPTALVTVPVDAQFTIGPVRRRARSAKASPRIGVAGWVYGTGRKGESLYRDLRARMGRKGESLLHDLQARLADVAPAWHTTGDGWTPETTVRPWAQMPDFYRGLDLYVCTSLIEGGPLPPLEALACGIPVVIPRDVGWLDEVPDHEYVFRYAVGTADDLERTVRRALAIIDEKPVTGPVRRELAALVQERTAAAWRKSLRESFSLWNSTAVPAGDVPPCQYHPPGMTYRRRHLSRFPARRRR